MESKLFHLGDILSITTGKLMSPQYMDGVHNILNFMTGDTLGTNQLGRAKQECAPFLLQLHPQLDGLQINGVTKDNFESALEDLCAEYGEYLLVKKVPMHVHEFIDPMSELAEKVHPDKIIALNNSDN